MTPSVQSLSKYEEYLNTKFENYLPFILHNKFSKAKFLHKRIAFFIQEYIINPTYIYIYSICKNMKE